MGIERLNGREAREERFQVKAVSAAVAEADAMTSSEGALEGTGVCRSRASDCRAG